MKKTPKLFIGIAGASGSGKTTICKKLKLSSKRYEHIRLDNYFRSPETFPKKYGFRNWEVPSNLKFGSLLRHLKTLKRGDVVRTRTFPKGFIEKRRPVILRPKEIVVVEGFLLFTDKKIRDFLDIKIYLDIPLPLMLKRRKIRFGDAHVNEYDIRVAIPEFLKRGIKQKRYADYIINVNKPLRQIEVQIKKIIQNKN